jgi:hypothetical protein
MKVTQPFLSFALNLWDSSVTYELRTPKPQLHRVLLFGVTAVLNTVSIKKKTLSLKFFH